MAAVLTNRRRHDRFIKNETYGNGAVAIAMAFLYFKHEMALQNCNKEGAVTQEGER